jgi:UDP-2,3-diacylglucosamine pyrophosphatase LpxH
MKTVIISDCHIGSLESNHNDVLRFLRQLRCDRLIINGDFWELWEMSVKELSNSYSEIVTIINNMNNEVIYVTGNHDKLYTKIPLFSKNVRVTSSYTFVTTRHRKVIVVHGHQFDSFLWSLCQKPLAKANYLFRKCFGFSYKNIHSDDRKAVVNLKNKSRKYYEDLGYDIVIVGHTHAPELIPDEPIFINCGDWKMHNTFVTIENDSILLEKF